MVYYLDRSDFDGDPTMTKAELHQEMSALVIAPEIVQDLDNEVGELRQEVIRLRAALEDIQREAMAFKPPRHSWYYDRAQNALANSEEPLVRNGIST